jgi:sortase A
VQAGDSLTRLKIPSIDVDVVVVEGTDGTSLRAGAGHYSSTPLPCEQGNVGIAGHRTTYGRPFNHLDLVEVGDLIVLEVPIGTCTYRVTKRPFIVLPENIQVLAATDTPTLTLTTCHPKGSAKQRLIVQAELVSSDVTA